ncbi:MAG: hypothetical protein KDJ38_08405, partial [Gammaproteobacteria bacterium]|nr:hypothetical protein [Gammaproteobacteria bacterium]
MTKWLNEINQRVIPERFCRESSNNAKYRPLVALTFRSYTCAKLAGICDVAMKVLFVSRRNNQAKYFSTLKSVMPFESSVHIIGTKYYRTLYFWRFALEFNPSAVVSQQLERRRKKFPRLLTTPIVAALYARIIGFKERCRYAKYIALFKDESPDYVGLWNGKKMPGVTIARAAKDLSIAVFYFENGLLPGTCTLDDKGVNQDSSLPRNAGFYRSYPFASQHKAINGIVQRPPLKRRKKAPPQSLPQHYVFVPFQVPDDTQIVCHSPWIKNMEALFEAVMEAFDQHTDRGDMQVVFKEHPSWPGHFEHLYERHPAALFANGNTTPELIENSLGLITINSTVGLEGLILKKPVMTLGEACYRIDGLVLSADNQQQLNEGFEKLLSWSPDAELRDRYLRFLNEVYCIPDKWSTPGPQHFAAVADRFLARDEFSQLALPGFNAG